MSNFINLFPAYESSQSYTAALVSTLEEDENSFFGVNPLAGTYGFNNVAYTIGYGYDVSKQPSGKQIISDFKGAAIFTAANTGLGGQYASLYALLQNYKGSGNNSTKLGGLNTAFGAAFGTKGITQPQAVALLNDTTPRYASALATFVTNNAAQQNGFTLGNNGLQLFLMTEWYNGGSNVFGRIQAGDIAADNVIDFLADTLFFSNTANSKYNKGIENRRMSDMAAALGLMTSTDGASGLTILSFGGNANAGNYLYAPLDIAQSLAQLSTDIATRISSLAVGNTAATNLTNLASDLLTSADTAITGQGYYVPQPTKKSWKAIAAGVSKNNSVTITGAELEAMNDVLPGSIFSVGGLLYVPISATALLSFQPPSTKQQAYVLDPNANNGDGVVYVVGASLDGGDAGQLIVEGSNNSAAVTLQMQSYEEVSYTSEVLSGTITDQSGAAIGTFTSNLSTDNNLQVSTGASASNVNVSGTGDLDITSANVSISVAAGSSINVALGSDNTLILNNPRSFSGTISGFAPGDTIDLEGIGTATSATLGANNALSMQGGTSAVTLQLDPSQSFAGDTFSAAPDGNGGTDVAFGYNGYNYTTIKFPSAYSGAYALGINDKDEIVGLYHDASAGNQEGFLDNNGVFSTISVPGTDTAATAINNDGVIVGWSGDATGFMDANGVFTSIVAPGAAYTYVTGINDAAEMVGWYNTSRTGNAEPQGFLDDKGTFTTIDVPGASYTEALGINNNGQVVGEYAASPFAPTYGFLYSDGKYSTYNTVETAIGINDAGQIIGGDAALGEDVVLNPSGAIIPIAEPDATGGAFAVGINDSGVLVGNGNGVFLATPAMTQAQDLAAMLTGATAGNTLISDTLGDALTPDAIAKTILTANAGDFKFV